MLNHLYKKTNHYRDQYYETEKFLSGVPRQLEMGCFGSSYARFDLDFDETPIKGFNFGIYPQSLHYDLILLRHYLEYFKKGAFVIFTFPALVFALDNYDDDKKNFKYYKFLSKNEILNYNWKTKIFEVEFPLLRYPDLIKKIWNDDDRIGGEILWDTSENLYEKDQAESAAKSRKDGWCKQFGLQNLRDIDVSDAIKDTFVKNRKRVEDMLELCEEHDLKPILLIPPVAECLYKLFSRDFLDMFLFDNIDHIAKKNTIVLNYLEKTEFRDYRLYSNADFMNRIGRKKFTECVIKDLLQ